MFQACSASKLRAELREYAAAGRPGMPLDSRSFANWSACAHLARHPIQREAVQGRSGGTAGPGTGDKLQAPERPVLLMLRCLATSTDTVQAVKRSKLVPMPEQRFLWLWRSPDCNDSIYSTPS